MSDRISLGFAFCLSVVLGWATVGVAAEPGPLRAGAASVDITPTKFPVIVNGGFLEKTASEVHDPLHARCLVLDDGSTRIALEVVDVCLMPAEMLDRAKAAASKATGIPASRIMISATHTHSAPSCMGALGTPPDPEYPEFLVPKLVSCIERAAANLAPARVGWSVAPASEHTNCRRWIYRPDRMLEDPFGTKSVRANMHPGYQNPDVIGPSGPIDPDLTLLSVQHRDGRPLALFANFSMHYFGAPAISADHCGAFAAEMTRLIGGGDPGFVAILSQGTAGDLHWMNYAAPKRGIQLPEYVAGLARIARDAYTHIQYRDGASLAMAETVLRLRRRAPDAQRLAWAEGIVDAMGGRKPKDRREVYALEQIVLDREPERDVRLQAIRVGDLGITAWPTEVFGITGLKLKAQSPLVPTFNIELANGEEGYIPPPAQHSLGGYTTWPARSAALEVGAEPKIVEAMLGLLEKVSGKARRAIVDRPSAYSRAVLDSRPLAYWRLNEFEGPSARDATGKGQAATYESRIAFYLPGPDSPSLAGAGQGSNRAPHLAGGKICAPLSSLGGRYTVEFWFWNGLPADARPVTGCLLSRGGDRLVIGGTGSGAGAGRLCFGRGTQLVGHTEIAPKRWHHVALVRDGQRVRVYLDAAERAEIEGATAEETAAGPLLLGGDPSGECNLEGKLDETSVFDRALAPSEIAAHRLAAGEVN